MEEFKFNSESSYKSTGERNGQEPIVLSFKSEPSCFAPAKKSKGHKGLLTVLSVALIVCISFASGAAGAFIVNNTTATPAETTVSVSPSVDAIGQTYLTTSTDSGAYTSVAAAAKPTVVEITTEMATGGSYFQQYITSGAGSGVIITSDGYIITNNHVIDGATKITVRLSSGVEYPATLIGADAQSDIAVIKIEEIALPHATIGNSSALAVGEEVLAIGNPLGTLGGSVTNGIISALGREITVDGQKMTLLQTNAAINPGNSGGGLFNMNGELVAIVNAKSSGESIEGLGFAIPINDAYSIAQALMENGYVLGRPALGISYIAINDYMDLWRYGVSSYGIYVYDGGETGLENGDRIVRIGDYEVADTATLKSAIQNYKVGDTVNITVVRRGRYADVSVTLIENKPAETKIELQANN
ncbi:MAG: trypsin-like peptidase domain-containing protein [Clostridia bacterium]|nr:trypsin-like peptidase domain-containing protein [Clostridia bacterium]